MEKPEKREASGSPAVKKKGKKDKAQLAVNQQVKTNKLDRASIAKGHKVPLPMNSVAFGNTTDFFSKHGHHVPFEAALNQRKKHLAALYANCTDNMKEERFNKVT